MKCLDDCHTYELDLFHKDFEVGGLTPASFLIHFFEMKEDGFTINGVTNEEVLRVLIHRMGVLNKKMPCFENTMTHANLVAALSWLEARTENRVKRNVEGTHKP